MEIRKEASGLLVVSLEIGDDLRSCIEGACKENGILGAKVEAIGALKNPVLGYYDLDARDYSQIPHPGNWELMLLGNISTVPGKDEDPFLHAHVTISGPDLMAKMGHLFEAEVAVVTEVVITPFGSPLRRAFDERIGLSRWSCPIHKAQVAETKTR